MSDPRNQTDPDVEPQGDPGTPGGDRADELPEVGYIADEQLPEDLQPTDDNPLAKNPGEDDGDGDSGDPAAGSPKVEGMPDMGNPGPPA
jgi:hypothetical protein